MNSDKDNHNKVIGEVNSYLSVISSQDSLLQNYRGLFLGIESFNFALAFIAIESGRKDYTDVIASIGLLLCILWLVVCNHRGWIIDKIKGNLRLILKLENVNCKDILQNDNQLKQHNNPNLVKLYCLAYGGGSEKWVPRFTFNIIIPILYIFVWLAFLLGEPFKIYNIMIIIFVIMTLVIIIRHHILPMKSEKRKSRSNLIKMSIVFIILISSIIFCLIQPIVLP